MSSDLFGIFLVIVALVVVVAAFAWHVSRSRSILQRWADDNGYEILDSEYRILRLGPFFLTTSKGQAVYHVVVRDRQGRTRSGYVRCGSWWWGMLSDDVEVRWDES